LYFFLKNLDFSYDNGIMGTDKQVNVSFDPWIRDAIEQLRNREEWKDKGKKKSIAGVVNTILEMQLEKLGFTKGKYTARNLGLNPETGESSEVEYNRLMEEYRSLNPQLDAGVQWGDLNSFDNKTNYTNSIVWLKTQIATLRKAKENLQQDGKAQ
jgi:hypothetical protein